MHFKINNSPSSFAYGRTHLTFCVRGPFCKYLEEPKWARGQYRLLSLTHLQTNEHNRFFSPSTQKDSSRFAGSPSTVLSTWKSHNDKRREVCVIGCKVVKNNTTQLVTACGWRVGIDLEIRQTQVVPFYNTGFLA